MVQLRARVRPGAPGAGRLLDFFGATVLSSLMDDLVVPCRVASCISGCIVVYVNVSQVILRVFQGIRGR